MVLVCRLGQMVLDMKVFFILDLFVYLTISRIKNHFCNNQGQWKENKACGKGKFYHVDGDTYDGEWRDDKANGHGTYIHVNGAKYDGKVF